jgi:class 3 adenylate cyclase
MRESMTAEVAAAYREEFADADLRAIYERIPVSTLLCVAMAGPGREASLALASVVPNCRVTTIPDAGNDFFLAAILEFMGVDAAQGSAALAGESSTPPPPVAASGMKAIMFTDIADSTALTERMGDVAFRSTARALDERMRAAITSAGGSAVDGKLLGDGVMAVFTSAAQAIEAARRCIELSAENELRLHVGLHAGDAIHEDGNVYGGAVNIAARVCALSAPGEILVSATMRELARTSAGAAFEDRGERDMKGIGEPIRVFAVQ